MEKIAVYAELYTYSVYLKLNYLGTLPTIRARASEKSEIGGMRVDDRSADA